MSTRTLSREFKLPAVRAIASGEKRPAQVCRDQSIATSVLARWRAEDAKRGENAFGLTQETEAGYWEKRAADLERFCGQLALEN